jgi:signal transduction histidine kinase
MSENHSATTNEILPILVVDDNQAIHDDFRMILEPEDRTQADDSKLDELLHKVLDSPRKQRQLPLFELHSAFQGQEALSMVRQATAEGRPYAFIFMDVRMPPGWNGIETIERIWRYDPNIEVVLCTAYSDYSWEGVQEILGDTHRLQILKKPFDTMEVKQLALSLAKKVDYYRKYQRHIGELEQAVKNRTRELEEAKAAAELANRAKSTFLANMSHELRTPLNGILGYADLMSREGDLPPPQDTRLQVIERCGIHLLSLINNVLDLSKIEAGLVEKADCRFDLPRMLEDLRYMFLPRLERRQLSFSIDRDGGLPRVVWGDERKLRQILINLLGNAVKFTPEGGEVSLAVDTRPSGIRFTVADTGPGIAAENQQRIFEPFRQLHAVSTESGTGLGLSICRHFVDLLGGKIQLQSELGKGSRFRFTLPLDAVEGDPSHPERARKVIGLAGERQWRLLVVDDNATDLGYLRDLLKAVGFMVATCSNGEEALQAFRGGNYDLIVSDVKMPEMDGEKLLAAVKREKGDFPVILTSSYVLGTSEKQLQELGADVFLGKPIDSERLLDAIRRCLPLNYRFKEGTDDSGQAHKEDLVALFGKLPSQQQQELRQSYTDGNLKKIRETASRLKDEPEWSSLGSYICELATRYDMDGLQRVFCQQTAASPPAEPA